MGLKPLANRSSRRGCWKVAGKGAGRGSSARTFCWKGARKVVEWVTALEGSAGRVRLKGVPPMEGGFRLMVPTQNRVRVGVPTGVLAGIVSPISPTLRPLSGHCGCMAATRRAGRVGGSAAGARGQCSICGGHRVGRVAGRRRGDLASECSSQRGALASSCSSPVKPRGTRFWSSMWRQRVA